MSFARKSRGSCRAFFVSHSPDDKESAGMTVTAAYLIALALTLLLLIKIWESLS
jgi:hypothetical protein